MTIANSPQNLRQNLNQKFRPNRTLWIIVFSIILAVSGLALIKTGNFRNPVGLLHLSTFIGGGNTNQGTFGGESSRGRPNGNTGGQAAPPQGGFEGGDRDGGREGSISLSRAGGVLYNIWLIAAITDMVIIVQTVGGNLIKRFKLHQQRRTSPTPLSAA